MAKQTVQNDLKHVTSVITIPGYKIVDVLGRGGMAIVYRAIQESIGRTVALKVLAPNPADDSFTDRFLREAKIISNLTHPNIITVFDAGVHKSHHYMSMEFITGKTLRQARDDISRKEKIMILKQIALALDYAGNKGYVHRDIKPDNIMMHDEGRAVLMDFGIARGDDTAKGLTLTGKAIGTPYYMSPEQTKGVNVDPRSDIYSLGVVLFQALTGHVPYDGTSFVDIGIKHISEPIPLLPKNLEIFQSIINTAMSKKAEHRYQSAMQFANALNSISTAELDYIDAKSAVLNKNGNISKTEMNFDASKMIDTEIRPLAQKINKQTNKLRQKSGLKIQAQRAHVSTSAPQEVDITSTDDFKALGRRRRLLLLVFISCFIGAAYYNKIILMEYWSATVAPFAFKYLPADVLQQVGMYKPKVVKVNDKVSVTAHKVKLTPKIRTDNLAVYLFDISNIKLNAEQIAIIQNSTLISKTERQVLFKNLVQQPDDATILITYYKKLLIDNKISTVSRNGLTKLRRWFIVQLNSNIQDKNFIYAAHLLLVIRENFPNAVTGGKYQSYQRQVVRFENIQSHLRVAENLIFSKNYLEPEDNNALIEINAVLQLEPNNDAALTLRQTIVDFYVAQVKQRQVDGDYRGALDSAESGLNVIKNDAFLKSSYQNLQQLLKTQQQVSVYLELAQQKMEQASYVSPINDNAYSHYKAVFLLQANNKAALQGLKRIESKLVKQAQQAIQSYNFSNAVLILQLLEQYYPDSIHLKKSQTALAVAIDSTQPKITNIVFSDILVRSLQQMRKIRIQSGKIIYVGLEYKNFNDKINYLQIKILDNSAITKLVHKTIKLDNRNGQQIVAIKIPNRELPAGNYFVEIKLRNKSLIKKSFQIFRP